MMPNSFLIQLGKPSFERAGAVFANNAISLWLNKPNDRFIKISHFETGFVIFVGETCHEEPHQSTGSEIPAGTFITFCSESNNLIVKCDRLGTAIIYWKQDSTELLLSNRKENLITQADEPDWPSIQQYLHTGFTIKSTTFIKGISQTEPNTILTASYKQQLNLALSKRSDSSVHEGVQTADLIDQIADQLSRKLLNSPPSVLMMSAGWDSRTLLLPGTSHLAGAYTHGDLSSREITLARSLTGAQRLDHLFVDVESCPITSTLIDSMLHDLGSGIFPIWFIAAQNIRNWKNAPIMSGVLGELLGGHYGLMSWGSRTQKLLSSLSLLSDSLVNEQQVHSRIDRYCTPPQSHWFTSSSGQEILDASRVETKERAQFAINEHHKETGNWQLALEDFNMAHRARQYILKQAQAATSSIGYTIPFADEKLSDLVRAVDFKYRIHNKANQRILQARKPALLREPMAATLIAAKYPILFQEFSRVFRIAGENASLALGKDKPRLGWFNYEHLYQSAVLHDLADSLTQDIWDKSAMHATINSNIANGIDAGSTLDMLCKIKTVDYYLRQTTCHIGMYR
jgi:hypothetical protein